MKIILLGDPQHKIDDVASILIHAGMEIEINSSPFDGAQVVVFVSCLQGVSNITLDILEQWNGKKVNILAVILTEASFDLDSDLLELVFIETQWVIFNKPETDAIEDRLACLRSDNIFIADELQEILEDPPPPVIFYCNRKGFERYSAGFE